MKRKIALRAIALSVGTVLGAGSLAVFAGCGTIPVDKDALVIMTEDLNELYNPFYSTAGTDMDVVGNTQISMLSTDENGELAYGKDEPTVVLDYEERHVGDTTEYYYVLKNGLQFSDGEPLTMNDVMFNLYVYLDPAYTGSSTMYSTDIVGLQAYRTQKETSDDSLDEEVNSTARTYATNRRRELIDLYNEVAEMDNPTEKHRATPAEMEAAIKEHSCGDSYLEAIGAKGDQAKGQAQLLQDYNDTLTKFREELKSDYKGARSSYTEEPYKSAKIYYQGTEPVQTGFDEIVSFMYTEGFVTIEYGRDSNNQYDKSKIDKATLDYNYNNIKTETDATNYVYNSMVPGKFDQILEYWRTGTEMYDEFVAKAKDVILHGDLGGDELKYKSVSGIVSLGHNTDKTKETIHGTEYKIAQEHNTDGTPKNAGEYDVLRITINKIDPKAKWNFGFTVAPYHYYSSSEYEMDIKNYKFGVKWADFDFQTKVLQGTNSWGESKNKIPVGAGPYVATDKNNSDKPTAEGFFNNDIVYYKANKKFSLNGVEADGGKFVPKIEKMRYMETPVSNALSSLESGQVHFVSPQFTNENAKKIEDLKSKGIGEVDSWQLGYGYIGINASEVKQLELRKAIMAAMDTSLALQYYVTGTAVNVNWPMSAVSWAYPRSNGAKYDGANPTANMETDNAVNNQTHDYTHYTTASAAETLIKQYMAKANYKTDDLKVEFTIAGANMYDHPAYLVFKNAMDLLNKCGWDVTIKPDANALTKLSTGSLAVWAAAWGSTIDPDMYQVYHKNSTATSVKAWGYDAIKDTAQSEYAEERTILNKLSEKIDDARETDNQETRASIYKEAMGYVLDLAVELPLYQRKTLYAYNTKVIKEESMPHDENGNVKINPYTSPLAKIWEIEFTD